MANQEVKLNFQIPPELLEKNVVFKVNKPKLDKENSKFRSFLIGNNNTLLIDNNSVPISYLINLLQEYGLSKWLPINVKLGKEIQLLSIDWHPLSYVGQTSWSFNWPDTSKVDEIIKCSIVGTNNTIYIRVHDLRDGVGERVLSEICIKLLERIPTPPKKTLIIYRPVKNHNNSYSWYQLCTRIHRDINTIYIDPKIKDMLIGGLEKFFVSDHIYDQFGVTYKRIHLFHGPPGGGKTSTVLALASTFGKNIAKLTITPDLNSEHLESLFQYIPTNSFVLLEDVDALFTKRDGNKSLDFSTMLNCMDGIATTRGLVMFMTTNHVLNLDPAFMRPGRVDCSVEFQLATRHELSQALNVLGEKWKHEHEEFLDTIGKDISIAELQKHLFDCIMEERISILE